MNFESGCRHLCQKSQPWRGVTSWTVRRILHLGVCMQKVTKESTFLWELWEAINLSICALGVSFWGESAWYCVCQSLAASLGWKIGSLTTLVLNYCFYYFFITVPVSDRQTCRESSAEPMKKLPLFPAEVLLQQRGALSRTHKRLGLEDFKLSVLWVVRFRSKMPEAMRKLDGGFGLFFIFIRTVRRNHHFLTTYAYFSFFGGFKPPTSKKLRIVGWKMRVYFSWYFAKFAEVRGWANAIHHQYSALGISGGCWSFGWIIQVGFQPKMRQVKVNLGPVVLKMWFFSGRKTFFLTYFVEIICDWMGFISTTWAVHQKALEGKMFHLEDYNLFSEVQLLSPTLFKSISDALLATVHCNLFPKSSHWIPFEGPSFGL